MTELGYILLGTLAGGVISVVLAAFVSFYLLEVWVSRLVSFAVGMLLAVALTHLLPESIQTGLGLEEAGAWLLGGILGFFALEKLAIWRHDHSASGSHVDPAATMVVVGDAMHNFVDGILIAAAFLQGPAIGIAATMAVIAHEVPQEIGEFLVLLESGLSRRSALALNVLSSLSAVIGGVLGWFVLSAVEQLIPYALVLAAAGFVYVAVADLVPALHRRRGPWVAREQIALIVLGVLVGSLSYGH